MCVVCELCALCLCLCLYFQIIVTKEGSLSPVHMHTFSLLPGSSGSSEKQLMTSVNMIKRATQDRVLVGK
jgi:hypothetical protein